MKIYLVRHGQSEGNVNKAKYFEKLDCDIELTEKGKDDAIDASNSIMDMMYHFDTIESHPRLNPLYYFNCYYSTYTRARQTAHIMHDNMTKDSNYRFNKFEETPLIREREWGGLRDIVEMGRKTEDHFNFHYRPTGGESFADCYQRAVLFHQHLLTTSKYDDNIIVAHGEFNKMYMMYLLGWSVEESNRYKNPKNGEVFLIDTDTGLSSLTPLTLKS